MDNEQNIKSTCNTDEEKHVIENDEDDFCLGLSDEECADLECADPSSIDRKKRRKKFRKSKQSDSTQDESYDCAVTSHIIPSSDILEDQVDECNIEPVPFQSSQLVPNNSHNISRDSNTVSCQHLIETNESTNSDSTELKASNTFLRNQFNAILLEINDKYIEPSAMEGWDEVEDELIGVPEITTPYVDENRRSGLTRTINLERANSGSALVRQQSDCTMNSSVRIPVASSAREIIIPTAKVVGTLPPLTHERMSSFTRNVSIGSLTNEEEDELSYDEVEILEGPMISTPKETFSLTPSSQMVKQLSTNSVMPQIEEHKEVSREDMNSTVETQNISLRTFPSFDKFTNEKKFNKHGKKCAAPGTVEFVRAFCQTDSRCSHDDETSGTSKSNIHYWSPYQSQRTVISSVREEIDINDSNDTFDTENPSTRTIPYAIVASPLHESSFSATDVRIPAATVRNPFRDKRVFSFLLVALSCIFGLGYGFVVQSNKLKDNDATANPENNSKNTTNENEDNFCGVNGIGCKFPGGGDSNAFKTMPPKDSGDLGYFPSPSSVDIAPSGGSLYTTTTPTLSPTMMYTPGNFSTPITEDFHFVDGCMFNVHAGNSNIKFNSIDILLSNTGGSEVAVEVWTKKGSYINDVSRDSWVNVFGDQTVTVVGNGPTQFAQIDPSYFKGGGGGSNDLFLRKKKIRAFYVTVKSTDESTKNLMISGIGDREGQIYLSNKDISITDGTCFGYPFNENNDRLVAMRWFGSLNYEQTGFNPFASIP